MVKNTIGIIVACLVVLVGCASSAPTPTPLPPKTVVVTQAEAAPPAPQVVIPPGFTEALQRLAAVEGKVTMLESSLKLSSQNTPASLKNMQVQIDAYAGYKYDMDTIKARLAVIEARLTAAGH